MTRLGSAQEALEVLCRRSDVIVAWRSSHFARLMAQCQFAGQVVIVAHGSAASTVRMLEGGKGAAQHLVGVSKAAAAAFRHPRAAVLHNGADTTRCAATLPREETRRRWEAEPGDVLLGYVGLIHRERLSADVRHALALLRQELSDHFEVLENVWPHTPFSMGMRWLLQPSIRAPAG